MEATNTTLERMLRAYGLTSTILVPSDAAFDAALAAYGPALRDAALLTEILKFHILPPEPRTRGLWTSPFLSVGATVYTLFDGVANLKTAKKALPAGTTAQGGLTGIVISGPVNSATVVESDIRACKTFITIIDEVLLPFDPTGIDASNDSGALGAALGAGTCSVVPNAQINATTLVQGGSNPQASPAACCASCAANAECNTWSYCGLAGGCRFPEGLVIPVCGRRNGEVRACVLAWVACAPRLPQTPEQTPPHTPPPCSTAPASSNALPSWRRGRRQSTATAGSMSCPCWRASTSPSQTPRRERRRRPPPRQLARHWSAPLAAELRSLLVRGGIRHRCLPGVGCHEASATPDCIFVCVMELGPYH